MKDFMGYFIYVHTLFALMLYLFGSFTTVVALEYKAKKLSLNNTLAAFGCAALSALFAYIMPMYVFGGMPLVHMQIVGIISALAVQALFWWLWFKKEFKKNLPMLAIAFIITVIVSVILYNISVWYFRELIQAAVTGVMKGIAKGAAALGAVNFFL